MRNGLLALALLAAALPVRADVLPMDADALRWMNKSVADYKQRFTPAPVEAKTVKSFTDFLIKHGAVASSDEGVLHAVERVREPDAQGVAKNRQIYLVELPEQEGEGPIRGLVYRRTYSHLVATSEDWSRGEDGSRRVEIWRYTLTLDGTLYSVVRQTVTVKDAGALGQEEPDPKGSHTDRMRPSDPVVQKRWKELAAELARLMSWSV